MGTAFIMGIIRRIFEYLDEHSFLILYKSLARPHLEYALKKHSQAIENVQRRATKLIPGFQNLEYEERLKCLSGPVRTCKIIVGDPDYSD